ncbi:type II restriction endonuclease [Mycoplasmatota bacterium]|nr:type II restriction endonuclease [Mycoplasmatota bacterium]
MKREFNDIMNSLKDSVADYKYYTDFDKVFVNVKKFKVELNILNSLLGSNQIEIDFMSLLDKFPVILNVVPLLLAVRKMELPIVDDKPIVFNFKERVMSDELYLKFMRKSGLFNLMENNKVKCLYDYIVGVEVGLDSNARKNRTGRTMENIVESYISRVECVEYFPEMRKKEIANRYNINLDRLILADETKKDAEKKFDFVIKTSDHLYLIETNFYTGGGSKLNETARSFKSIANDIRKIDGVSFVWITDGVGWRTAKNNLRETYDVMEHFYTLKDLEEAVLEEVIK